MSEGDCWLIYDPYNVAPSSEKHSTITPISLVLFIRASLVESVWSLCVFLLLENAFITAFFINQHRCSHWDLQPSWSTFDFTWDACFVFIKVSYPSLLQHPETGIYTTEKKNSLNNFIQKTKPVRASFKSIELYDQPSCEHLRIGWLF